MDRKGKQIDISLSLILLVGFLICLPTSAWVATQYVVDSLGAGYVVGSHTVAHQEAAAQDAVGAGVKWTREDFPWYLMQSTPGTTPELIDSTTEESVINTAVAYGLNTIGVLAYSPSFYSSNSSAANYYAYPPTSTEGLNAWTNFVSTTVNRFKDRIHHWQVWPSCDDRLFWALEPGSPDNGATKYVALLQRAYTAIKTEDPTATVHSCTLKTLTLDAILDAGAAPHFDVIAMGAYVEPYAPEVSFQVNLLLASVRDIRDRRIPGKRISVTGFGWPTSSHSTGVDYTTQAAYTVRSFLIQSSTRDLETITQMLYQDRTVGGSYSYDDPLDNYGMLVMQGTDFPNLHKPSYDAYKAMATALQGTVPMQPSILSPASTSLLEDFEALGIEWLVATGGGAAGTYIRTNATSYAGSWSGRIDYDYTSVGPGDAAVTIFPTAVSNPGPLSGTPARVSVRARGDGGGPAPLLSVAFVDDTGEIFTAILGMVSGTEWRKFYYCLDAPEQIASLLYTAGGGPSHDGVIDYPITFRDLGVRKWQAGPPATSGTVWVDDILFEYGTTVFDHVYVGSTATVHAVWTLTGSQGVSIPTSAASATTRDWQNNAATVPAIGGFVSVSANQHPLFVSLPPPD